jgi:hypothetical protein
MYLGGTDSFEVIGLIRLAFRIRGLGLYEAFYHMDSSPELVIYTPI